MKKSKSSSSLNTVQRFSIRKFSVGIASVVVGSFFGALCVGILSTNASKILRMPATIFIYTGMIPLVPGYGMYNTMQNLVTKNYNVAFKVGIETILQAGAIAMGILLASVFSDSIKRVKIQRKK